MKNKIRIITDEEILDFRWVDTAENSHLVDIRRWLFVGRITKKNYYGKRFGCLYAKYDPQNAAGSFEEKLTLSKAKAKLLNRCRWLMRNGYWMKQKTL